ncbi:MAG: DUF1839 family protein, partial [Proteobacteria bacterium]|nr:DUF1839 family protein [Pseudomonadota bacterium]
KALQWLGADGDAQCPAAADAFMQLSQDVQILIFLGARAVVARRQLDPVSHLAAAANHWEVGLAALREHFGVARG